MTPKWHMSTPSILDRIMHRTLPEGTQNKSSEQLMSLLSVPPSPPLRLPLRVLRPPTSPGRTSNSPCDTPAPKAAFGARVKVLFEDKIYYWGTINSTGESLEDKTHPHGPWSVLFDDCTQGRFKEEEEGCTSLQSRLRRVHWFGCGRFV